MPSICSFSIQFRNLTAQLSVELGLKCRDSGTHCLVALLIGEGTVGCAQGQRVRHGLLALRDALALVNVEQLDRLEQLACCLLNSGLHGSRRNGIVNQNRDIAGGSRELGQRMIQLLRVDGSQQRVHLQLGSEYLAGQTVACGNGRMNGAEYADLLAVDEHLGAAAG